MYKNLQGNTRRVSSHPYLDPTSGRSGLRVAEWSVV